MNRKKFIIAVSCLAVFGLVFQLAPASVKAATVEELQAQINQLMVQITSLQTQLIQLQGQETPAWCHTFSTNLKYGDAGPEVTALQIALEKEGLYQREVNQPPHFDERLASAVVGFQEKYASEILTSWGLAHGTGFVGPTTRAKLNNLYGCAASSASCTDSDGGLNYNTKGTVTRGSAVNADVCSASGYLFEQYCLNGNPVQATYWCPNGCSNGACIAVAATTTPSITVLAPSGGQITEGANVIIDWKGPAGHNFSINLLQVDGNLSTTIKHGFVAPIKLCSTVSNETQEPGRFYYNWEAGYDAYGSKISSGNYKVLVYDCAGVTVSAESASPFELISSQTPSVTVLSPNGGETWVAGNTYQIKWIPADKTKNTVISRYQVGPNNEQWGGSQIAEVTGGIDYYNWTIPITGATYKWKVVVTQVINGVAVNDESDSSFIVAPSPTPSITVLSPNGGEKLIEGSEYAVRWNSQGVDGTAYVNISFYDSSYNYSYMGGGLLATVDVEDGSYVWNVVKQFSGGNPFVGDAYKIEVRSSSLVNDTSDNYFTIGQLTPPCDSYGDVNGDGYVNTADTDALNQCILGATVCTADWKTRADVNQDSYVNVLDSVSLKKYIDTGEVFAACTLKPPCAACIIKSCVSYGDVNGNGYVNLVDEALLKQCILGLCTAVQKARGDVNGDGATNVLDLVALRRYIIKIDTTFAACR